MWYDLNHHLEKRFCLNSDYSVAISVIKYCTGDLSCSLCQKNAYTIFEERKISPMGLYGFILWISLTLLAMQYCKGMNNTFIILSKQRQ